VNLVLSSSFSLSDKHLFSATSSIRSLRSVAWSLWKSQVTDENHKWSISCPFFTPLKIPCLLSWDYDAKQILQSSVSVTSYTVKYANIQCKFISLILVTGVKYGLSH